MESFVFSVLCFVLQDAFVIWLCFVFSLVAVHCIACYFASSYLNASRSFSTLHRVTFWQKCHWKGQERHSTSINLQSVTWLTIQIQFLFKDYNISLYVYCDWQLHLKPIDICPQKTLCHSNLSLLTEHKPAWICLELI